jgi:hypothetical protein
MSISRIAELLLGCLAILIGASAVLGGLFNWEWYFRLPEADRAVRLFGRGGARVFYVLIGAAFIAIGLRFARGHAPSWFDN